MTVLSIYRSPFTFTHNNATRPFHLYDKNFYVQETGCILNPNPWLHVANGAQLPH